MESLGFYNEDDLWGWVMQWTSDIKYMNTGTHAILIISFDCCRKFFSNQKMNQILIWYEKVCKWLKKIYLYILIRVYHCFCILRRSKIMQLFHTTFSIRSWHLQGREKKKEMPLDTICMKYDNHIMTFLNPITAYWIWGGAATVSLSHSHLPNMEEFKHWAHLSNPLVTAIMTEHLKIYPPISINNLSFHPFQKGFTFLFKVFIFPTLKERHSSPFSFLHSISFLYTFDWVRQLTSRLKSPS